MATALYKKDNPLLSLLGFHSLNQVVPSSYGSDDRSISSTSGDSLLSPVPGLVVR